uniref:Uncharacterized protein n=1 Tax=Avena sativa TaxID=4498 RepID=A0ACD5WHF9_AVESA
MPLVLKETTIVMGNRKPFAVVLLCCLLAAVAAMPAEHAEPVQDGAISTYLVHVAYSHAPRTTRNTARLTRAYTSFLRDTLPGGINAPAPSILYSYAHAMTGFAARLTARQAAHLEAQPSVLAVTPERVYKLHTTMSSSFLGLTPFSPLVTESNGGSEAVIGVIDSGIYPKGRESFAANRWMGPPPQSFLGECVSAPDFNATEYCNNKLVGAKFFLKGQSYYMNRSRTDTPLDLDGHGTHCASIAAGAPVPNANYFGFARGTAKGAASGARIASYSVCGGVGFGCTQSDVTAGINEAIGDGVDVLSISLGFDEDQLYKDPVMIGAFRAVLEGIFVSTPAGNDGPDYAPVESLAPWVCTVGASTMNREFRVPVVLGNGKTYTGYSLYSGSDPYGTFKPLVYGVDAGSAICEPGKLDPSKVKGKIVYCVVGALDAGWAVKQAGGAGAIIGSPESYGDFARADTHFFPAVSVTRADGQEIRNYSQTPNAVARFAYFGITSKGFLSPPSPRVASFSSRGPNRLVPEILKPDIIAPGVDIIAAWTGEASPSGLAMDTRRVKFNINSGTSMATPHVSGIAAMLKVARPDWSPAEIKSALMTTAYNLDNSGGAIKDMATGKEAGPFQLGAGHVDPNRALDPGLVYDANEYDYISFVCALGYTPQQIAILTGGSPVQDICSRHGELAVGDHNYPAFSVVFKSYDEKITQSRAVRNVGSNGDAVYTFSYRALPVGWSAIVNPSKLVFDEDNDTLEYEVTFSLLPTVRNSSETEAHSALVWTDGKHKVVSPIVLTWPAPTPTVAVV